MSIDNPDESAATNIAHVETNHVSRKMMAAFGTDRVELIKDERNRRPDARFRLHDETARVVAYPRNTTEISEMLKLATSENWRVVPAGAGTWLEMGNPIIQQHLIISTAWMNRVLEYEPADLTCTVEAGATLAKFNQRASEHNQFLPLDPFGDERGTLGATIATGSYGALRAGYGTPRDWLVGIKVVHADGTITQAGGKVVKNVAGYDLCKLYTGSYGTLALIGEMSFKMRALPQAKQTLVLYADTVNELLEVRAKLNETDVQPSALELLSPQSGLPLAENKYALVLGFLNEEQETIEWQCETVLRCANGLTHSHLTEQQATGFWSLYQTSETADSWQYSLRLTGLPAELPALVAEAQRLMPTATLRAHAANGVLRVLGGAGLLSELRPKFQYKILLELREAARARGGQLVIVRAPAELKSQLDVWGDQGAIMNLLRGLKTQFDPHNRLNYGRYVAGL